MVLFVVWRLKVKWRQQVAAKRERRIFSTRTHLVISFTSQLHRKYRFLHSILAVGRINCQTWTQVYAAICVCVCVCVRVCTRALGGKRRTGQPFLSWITTHIYPISWGRNWLYHCTETLMTRGISVFLKCFCILFYSLHAAERPDTLTPDESGGEEKKATLTWFDVQNIQTATCWAGGFAHHGCST